ncbi:hypothetical protein JOL62DRAFT_233598 [Phyllosticta paracitricarpa]|uniref:Secreted protein n=1 Tax=Phyllosticta paracitricarpa TaxID=2016321 RepID=A0ABR1NIY9_9PEZI
MVFNRTNALLYASLPALSCLVPLTHCIHVATRCTARHREFFDCSSTLQSTGRKSYLFFLTSPIKREATSQIRKADNANHIVWIALNPMTSLQYQLFQKAIVFLSR